MVECTIPALLAAIQFLTQSTSSLFSTQVYIVTPCNHDPVSSQCYEYLADVARGDEARYREVVTDVVTACKEEKFMEGLNEMYPLNDVWYDLNDD